jgi:hypothetical protein
VLVWKSVSVSGSALHAVLHGLANTMALRYQVLPDHQEAKLL